MSNLDRDMIFLMLQYLDEKKYKQTRHLLEKESGVFFNTGYFEELVRIGEWEEVENYLSGFTKVDDNLFSRKIFFEIRKHKYLEALDKGDQAKAVEILKNELQVFSAVSQDLYKDMAMLLTMNNFREKEGLSVYGDAKSSRETMVVTLKPCIKSNPKFHDKLQFPAFMKSRLRFLIDQGLQHQLCKNRMPNPDITSPIPQVGGFSRSVFSKRPRPFEVREKVNHPSINALPDTRSHSWYTTYDLPMTVVANMYQGSSLTSMDFHPVYCSILLVGTNTGDITVWDVVSGSSRNFRNFKIWDLGSCSLTLQASMANENTASVNRVLWSPDGALFGVAYSKHIVQLLAYYHSTRYLRNHLEIESHAGSVNDLAFSHLNEKLCIITCGDDKTIKVWDAATGANQYTFEGHGAPVYSVCSHIKYNTPFIFSNSVDGKIKAWLYNDRGSKVDYDAPDDCCITMAYSADGKRLFSCGTSKDSESYMVEWDESQGTVKRRYAGLAKRSVGVVHFDTVKSRFLAAGDEFGIKYWDMDNENLLKSTDADGGLPASPLIRFNKGGYLLAVSNSENGFKILANVQGMQQYHSYVLQAPLTATVVDASGSKIGSQSSDTKLNVPEEVVENPAEVWKLTEINKPSQLCSLKLPDNMLAMPGRISRLTYTHSGSSILALSSNAVHKLWKWQQDDTTRFQATAATPPQLWQPPSGILMINDISGTNSEEAVPCFALSKNDSHVTSASGGKISLYDMISFKTMTNFKAPPPAATAIAFHPKDNNIVAIGMEDSSIQIYNIRENKIMAELKGGHRMRVTGIAFSEDLDVLVSSGFDAKLCVWDINSWEKKMSWNLQFPAERALNPHAQTRVQFLPNKMHLLVVHDMQIAIHRGADLYCVKKWVPPAESSANISDAACSCDGKSIFTSFVDGSVTIFTSLRLGPRSGVSWRGLNQKCRIQSTAYLPWNISARPIYPLVVAAHPTKPNQFALGLDNGEVHVLEPLEAEGEWGTEPPHKSTKPIYLRE